MTNREQQTMTTDHDDSATAPPEWALRVAEALERRRVPSGPDDYRTPEQIEDSARLIASVAGKDVADRQSPDALEQSLRSLLRGEHSSLILSFNDGNGPDYQSVAVYLESNGRDLDWVSSEERQRAIETNGMWELQWYPQTPIGFYRVAASSLGALLEYVTGREWP